MFIYLLIKCNHFCLFYESLENNPPFYFNSLNFPSSITFPSSRTKILSHFSIVLILCAIIITVLFYIAFSKAN